MAKNRKNKSRGNRASKRQAKDLTKTVQDFYVKINESFVSVLTQYSLDADHPEVVKAFEEHNQRWKAFARSIITKYPSQYPNKDTEKGNKRQLFITSFEYFVSKLMKKNSETVTPVTSDEDIDKMNQEEHQSTGQIDNSEEGKNRWEEFSIETIQDSLSRVGVKTKATKLVNLRKIVDKLDEVQKDKFLKLLGIL